MKIKMSDRPAKSELGRKKKHFQSLASENIDSVSECYYGGKVPDPGFRRKFRATFSSKILRRRVAAISDFQGPEVTLRKRWKIALIAAILFLILITGIAFGFAWTHFAAGNEASSDDDTGTCFSNYLF